MCWADGLVGGLPPDIRYMIDRCLKLCGLAEVDGGIHNPELDSRFVSKGARNPVLDSRFVSTGARSQELVSRSVAKDIRNPELDCRSDAFSVFGHMLS
jgi:hypothetical protein